MTLPIIKRYLIAFDQHKWKGLAACILVVSGAAFVAVQPPPPPEYQGDGILTYIQPPVIFSKTGTDIQQQAQGVNIDILVNPDVIEAAAAKAKTNPKQVAKNLQIKLPKPPGKGQAPPPPYLTFIYKDKKKENVDVVINTAMQAAIDRSRLINTSRLRAIEDEIAKRLPEAEIQLRSAEKELQKYTKEEGSILLAAENGSLIQGITGAQAQQRQIEFQLQGIESQISSLQQRLGLTPTQAYTSSALSADPIIANLRVQIYQIESQLQILRKDLRPEHPNIIALVKQQSAYEELLRQRAAEVMGGNGVAAPLESSTKIRQDSSLDPARQQLAQQLIALQTQKEALQQQLLTSKKSESQLREEYRKIPDKALEQARLQERLQLKQSLYSKIQAALIDAQAAKAEMTSSLSLVKAAEVKEITQPGQDPVMTIAIGVAGGIAVGGGLIFLLGALGGILHTMEDVRGVLVSRDIEILGIVPYILIFDPEKDTTPIVLSSDSPYLEIYERIRSNLRRASEKPPKMVLFASTIDQEGKSISAYNLAIASARAGKRTLVIEADLRSPSLVKEIGVAPDPDATVEPLRYYASWSDCIRLVPDVENLYVIPSPGPLRQPAAILESSEFRRLLEDVRGRFDMVIVDTPALSLCNDAFLLEPLTDGMVLVARPGYTGENMLSEAADRLSESEDLRLLGAIINGADIPLPIPVAKAKFPEEKVTSSEIPSEEALENQVPTKVTIKG